MKKIYYTIILLAIITLSQAANAHFGEWKDGVLDDSFIFETGFIPSVHASTIAETPSGLVVAFFGGQYEGSPDVGIYVSRITNEGWSKPVMVAEGTIDGDTRKACYNPVLFRYPDGDLLLFYKIGKNVQDWKGYLIRSSDDGQTWSTPETLPDGFLGPIKNKPELIGNKLICPSSTEDNGWQVYFEFTEDKGKTWRKTKPINSKPWNIIQPSIIRLKNGDLQVICRSQNEHLISSFSSDRGETWSDPVALYLPNNNSGTDAVTLNDGRHLLIYNHVMAKQSAYVDKARTPLNLAVSDDGITWLASAILEDSTIGEYSYPSIIQGEDGSVHIVYTWRRKNIRYVKVDPTKLIAKPLVNGKWPE